LCSVAFSIIAEKQQAFPFDPNPDWEKFYASGPDILAYIKRTVRKWNLDKDLQLNTRVIGAWWNQEAGEWKVTVEHAGVQRDEYCDVLISAQGVLVYVVYSPRCLYRADVS
jgi:cation diffusion facilitator CzcD-associated flavoprotein CzcO